MPVTRISEVEVTDEARDIEEYVFEGNVHFY
jgi:hypothetical protein